MTANSANARTPDRPGPFYRRIVDWLAGFEDGAIMRVAFFSLLLGTCAVLFVDFQELNAADTQFTPPTHPILPPYNPDGPLSNPAPAVTTDPAILQAPLTITLVPGGILRLTGTIDPGAANRFAAEIAARGEYIKTIQLDSPGGSVRDALTMGALIRAQGYTTQVLPNSLCASSCPLLLAGGKERVAAENSAIGVHQIFAASITTDPQKLAQTAGLAMADAQTITAQITRYLSSNGVDSKLWLHALDTPPDQLYYLDMAEMTRLKLVTRISQ